MGRCYHKIEIAQPIAKVWEMVSDFHDMSWASGVINSLVIKGDVASKEVGAKRLLNDVFHETLTQVNDDAYNLTYSIDDGPGPLAKDAVSNYFGMIQLSQTDTGTLVEWSSSFESDQADEVQAFCDPIYVALLSALKTTLER